MYLKKEISSKFSAFTSNNSDRNVYKLSNNSYWNRELDLGLVVGRVWLLWTDLILVVCILLPVNSFSFYGLLMECLCLCQKCGTRCLAPQYL